MFEPHVNPVEKERLRQHLISIGLPSADATSVVDAMTAVTDNALGNILNGMQTQVKVLGVDAVLLMATVGKALQGMGEAMMEAAGEAAEQGGCDCIKCKIERIVGRDLLPEELAKVEAITESAKRGDLAASIAGVDTLIAELKAKVMN